MSMSHTAFQHTCYSSQLSLLFASFAHVEWNHLMVMKGILAYTLKYRLLGSFTFPVDPSTMPVYLFFRVLQKQSWFE
ncbi:hypothetical protein RO3G_12110 [Rhizopus delemar RA 99-880]|uniref:Uncharacterized protein n=1 Tax=Rhizopus delemar (strain RA 99-880 / ATCC MYA-4621 / FGSC 9543 / NRRL 43880) TaxID=246409 RepID=I1CG19_RHIO9|nr:hypothetical protein RO3G_12110 [Rhizopus delemar RA 99-880]|eukprot:EIE87399.1 hypothetical protein RO3G_12110 [Rhizopus delemar RA 99-880]